MKKQEQLPVENLAYEQALAELEGIVAKLESNQLALEEMIALFERGRQLSRRCLELLEAAELRVQVLNDRSIPGEPG
ncbi:MAG TPA: exodeoxyribonuclease VII small subunit [Anaerolineaceae bacterium]|jgi:exodeoxyribonuclease VII small subunit|nr:exodeoxyribonuclease VII small subunit [Anaerolineaceae bacterium]NMD30345.1 exodeoxyribonuclease VII small subunit [Chloroflexota bacterium]HNZ02481.1 exodeoxyribonuclease VII small subunit [Anaerolineaceae bacterium]HOD44952.1 exodeoxyribonuclease VII small subunit [Anaerolineaceae bacterium]HOH21582.1 exodeoxyribonuclease VII small subunit [Anaerolineaceae bacterium]